jgi:hypothetical protein
MIQHHVLVTSIEKKRRNLMAASSGYKSKPTDNKFHKL